MRLTRPLFLLALLTALGILLHEIAHHLFGLPSKVSLAHNWPLVEVTEAARNTEIIGTLAGPTTNLLLGYTGLLAYSLLKRKSVCKSAALMIGVANSFLALSSTVINLIVDLFSSTGANDLQLVSGLLGINMFILPLRFRSVVRPTTGSSLCAKSFG